MRKKYMRMPVWKILWLLAEKKYIVCRETGQVTGPRGKVITPFFKKNDTTRHLYVRLYCNGMYVRSISLAKLVWISVTGRLMPNGFEAHHRDENPQNNAWTNIICVHALDHRKLHAEEVIPF